MVPHVPLSCYRFSDLPAYVADQIVQCLWLKVFSSPSSAPLGTCREKPGSREAYLKGRYFWNLRNEEGLRKAINCFESAIREDPEFALPYSGLADSLTLSIVLRDRVAFGGHAVGQAGSA